jgi:hypothetical protein
MMNILDHNIWTIKKISDYHVMIVVVGSCYNLIIVFLEDLQCCIILNLEMLLLLKCPILNLNCCITLLYSL